MAAPIYQGNAPIFESGGVSGDAGLVSQTAPAAAAAPKPTGKTINVVGPDGKAYSLDEAEVPRALEMGYKPETREQEGVRKYVEANSGAVGAATVGLLELANAGTFGVSDVLHRKAMDPYQAAQWEALKSHHRAAQFIGGAAGFGLSMLYGGPLFKTAAKAGQLAEGAVLGTRAAEAAVAKTIAAQVAARGVEEGAAKIGTGVARKILASSAKWGAEGAVLGAPKAIAEVLTGDPEKAGETLLYAAGGGAALGSVGRAIGLAGGGAAAAVGRAAAGIAERVAPAESGGVRGLVKGLSDEAAWRSLNPLVQSSREAAKIPGGPRAVGRMLKETGLLREVGEDWAGYAARVSSAKNEAGAEIGRLWRAADAAGAKAVDAEALATSLKPMMEKLEGNLFAGGVKKRLQEVIDPLAERIAEKGAITLEELHGHRTNLSKIIKENAKDLTTEEMKKLRRAITDVLESRASEVDATLGKQIKNANLMYRRLSAAEGAAQREVNDGLGRRAFSLTDTIAASGGMSLAGGPLGVVSGLAMGAANKFVRNEGAGIAARALDAVAEGRGLAALEGAFKSLGERLDGVPAALSTMSSGIRSAAPAVRYAEVSLLGKILDADKHEGLKGVDGVTRFADHLASLANHPTAIQDRVDEALRDVSFDAPQVVDAAKARAASTAKWLAEQAPRDPRVGMSGFAPRPQWKPTDAQAKDFRDKAEVALDPLRAIDHLQRGTLTKGHVDALQATAPKLYAEVLKRITDHEMSGKAKPMPYAARLKMSLMTGQPIDRSIQHIGALQQAYVSGGAAPGKSMKLAGPQVQTEIGRISG